VRDEGGDEERESNEDDEDDEPIEERRVEEVGEKGGGEAMAAGKMAKVGQTAWIFETRLNEETSAERMPMFKQENSI